jgi:hypothetical protein
VLLPGATLRAPRRLAVVATSATRPDLENAAVTRPLPPRTHHDHARLVLRRGAGSRRASAFRVMPSRTRPIPRRPIGERRDRQAPRADGAEPGPPAAAEPGQTAAATRRT